jgi:hypothetical protein
VISEGHVFGRWRVVAPDERRDRLRRRYWNCQCACGAMRILRADNLTGGSTKSCRCWQAEMLAARNRAHTKTSAMYSPVNAQ